VWCSLSGETCCLKMIFGSDLCSAPDIGCTECDGDSQAALEGIQATGWFQPEEIEQLN